MRQTIDEQKTSGMSFWGVGPSIEAPAIIYALLAGAATYVWPDWFALPWPPYPAQLVAGLMLLAIGLPLQAVAGRALIRAYNQDHLVTTGVYAICRNPLYANFIFTLLPAAALLCRSWLMLTASPLAYVLTRLRIRHEEKYLESRFGQDYLDYRRRTNAIFPTICCRSGRNEQAECDPRSYSASAMKKTE